MTWQSCCVTVKTEKQVHRKTCTQMFIAAPFIVACLWKQSKSPLTDEWLRQHIVYPFNRILFVRKKN